MVEVLFAFLLCTFLVAYAEIFLSCSARRKSLHLFTITLYFIMILVVPFIGYTTKDHTRFGNYYGHLFEEGVTIYLLSFLAYYIGYKFFIIHRQEISYRGYNLVLSQNRVDKIYFVIAIVIVFLTSLGLYQTGINLNTILDVESNSFNRYEAEGSAIANYLTFFGDSLIIWLLIGNILKVNSKKYIVLIAASFFLFLILGFRFRIILTIIGLSFIYFWSNSISFKSILKAGATFLIVYYLLYFISYNRYSFYEFKFQEVEFSYEKFKEKDVEKGSSLFYGSFSNFGTDFSVLKTFVEGPGKHDYGYSMFISTINRMIPSFMFEGGIKPKIPQQEIIRNSFHSTEGYYAGAAVTNIFEYYIAYGVLGCILLMFIIGQTVKHVESYGIKSFKGKLLNLIFILTMFQVITRGFTPQSVNHFVFLAIPYCIINLIFRKVKEQE